MLSCDDYRGISRCRRLLRLDRRLDSSPQWRFARSLNISDAMHMVKATDRSRAGAVKPRLARRSTGFLELYFDD